jgi:prophage regulatory protein
MAQDPRPFGELPATGYVRQSQLIPAPVPFSSATLWRRVKAGTFPKPVKLSERVTAWRVEDVRQWLDARATSHVEEVRREKVRQQPGGAR